MLPPVPRLTSPRPTQRRRPARRTSRRGRSWVLVLLVGVAAGLGAPVWLDARAAAQHPVTAADLAAGRAALDTLEVKGRAPRTGYEREEFGQRWADVDRNGCDTRNDALRRDLVDVTLDPATRGCVVLTGTLDPTLSDFFTATSVPLAHGHNIVNVILVDYRGFDTLGEISVLMATGIAILALIRGTAKAGSNARRPAPQPGDDSLEGEA